MDIKDKITQTLIGITAQLQEINSEFYIIGAVSYTHLTLPTKA